MDDNNRKQNKLQGLSMSLQGIDCCMDLIFGILAKSVLFFTALKRRLT